MGARGRGARHGGDLRTGHVATMGVLFALAGAWLVGCPDRGDDDDSAYVDTSCENYCLRMEEPLTLFIESEGCVTGAAQEVAWIDVYGQNCSLNPAEYREACAAAPQTASCRTCSLWFEDALQLQEALEVVTTCYLHYNDHPGEYDPQECEQACLTAGLEF